MKLYSYEIIGTEKQETFINNFTSEEDAFAKMDELEEHLVQSGYDLISKSLDYLVGVKTLSTGIVVKKIFELE